MKFYLCTKGCTFSSKLTYQHLEFEKFSEIRIRTVQTKGVIIIMGYCKILSRRCLVGASDITRTLFRFCQYICLSLLSISILENGFIWLLLLCWDYWITLRLLIAIASNALVCGTSFFLQDLFCEVQSTLFYLFHWMSTFLFFGPPTSVGKDPMKQTLSGGQYVNLLVDPFWKILRVKNWGSQIF